MKRINLTTILFLSGLVIFSCNKEDEQNDEFIYPLSVGNSWEYLRELNLYFYPDSTVEYPAYEDTLTISADISVSVTGAVFLNDTLETIEVVSIEFDTTNTYTGKHYYKNDDEGLYIYAYIPSGTIYPRKQEKTSIFFKGMEFDDFHQLSNFVHQLSPNSRILLDSIRFEVPPVKTLQYPIEIGAQWTYREDNDPWRMDKLVADQKIVELEIGTFDCYEIKWLYDFDHDGIWDDDIWIIDYLSTKGLIQRNITILRIIEMTTYGSTGRYFDGFDIYTLTELNVEE